MQFRQSFGIISLVLTAVILTLILSSCSAKQGNSLSEAATQQIAVQKKQTEQGENGNTEDGEMHSLIIMAGDRELAVDWEDNESVRALEQMAEKEPVNIDLSMYGGFEQVGPIGASLPRNDVQMTTEPGDIVLYSGNQLVVFYGSNSWSYTKLGHFSSMSQQELAELFSNGDVSISVCYR